MSSSAGAFVGRLPASGRALGRVVPGHCHGDGVDGGVHGVGLQGCPLRVVVLGLESMLILYRHLKQPTVMTNKPRFKGILDDAWEDDSYQLGL